VSDVLTQYRLLADIVRDIMLFVHPDGRIAEANPAALAAYGYTRDELLTRSIYDLRLPHDAELVTRQLAEANAAGIRFEAVHRRKDGSRFPVEVISQSAEIGGRPLLLSVIRDVSDRTQSELALRASEERFRTIANAAPTMFWLSDEENRCTWFNRPWLEFTGRMLEDEIGTGWMSGIHPDDYARYASADEAAFRRRAPITTEFRLRRSDGEYRWLIEQGAPLYAPDGSFMGYVGSCVDITDRRHEEERRTLLLGVSRLALEMPEAGPGLARAIFARIRSHLDADICVNYRIEADGSLRLETSVGIPEERQGELQRLRPNEAFCGVVGVSGQPIHAQAARIQSDPNGAFVRSLGMRAYSCHPLLGGDGSVLGTFSVGTRSRDAFSAEDLEFLQTISHFLALAWERRLAEEAARLGEEGLRLALTGARAGAWEADLVTGQATWSPELYELLGLDPREPPPSADGFFAMVHPDDRDRMRQMYLANISRSGRFEQEFRVIRPDGATIWIGAAGRVDCDEQGRPRRARGIDQDVSGRKAAEEQLRFALAASQAGVWTWHIGTGVLDWSPESYALYGVDPAKASLWLTDWESRLHPDDHARMLEAAREALEGRTAEFRTEFRIVHPQRGVRWIMAMGRIERGADGTPLRMSGINLDVTQRRETEARLQQAQRVQSVGRLAGGIAHEVNNLMTAVLGFGSFALAELPASHPAASEVEQMIRAGERAATITRQLLAFTRQQVLRPARLDLNEVVRDLVPVLERLVGAEHRLDLLLGTELGEVQADRGQIEQVLVNLTLNSRDAMGGGGVVTVSTSTAELDEHAVSRHPGIELRRGRYLLLSVSDTGAGMDEVTRARVFEPFFTTKPVGQGTGLGLSTVYGIVKQSDGYVWLYSEPGLGTTVKVYLPVVAEGPEPLAPTGRREIHLPKSRGEIVLVAEDEEMVRSLARRTLELHGYRVVEAADGRAALDLLERLGGGVDLVLSDAVMPELSGRALGEIIGTRWPSIPVIYMSGYPGKEVVERGLVSPDAPFVSKPFTPEALARRTREVLDAARSWPGHDPARAR
jgi:two-component system, cell cycle sensor histidine kinase and response regulator CckA